MSVVLIGLLVVFSLFISIMKVRNHKQKIIDKVLSIGGEIISIEKKAFSIGPFLSAKKGRTVYRIKYRKDAKVKVGWVIFNDLTGPDWKL
jgi:hypothetical protein